MKTTLYWVLAVIITIAAAYYQRKTGPTRPKKVEFTISNINYTCKLLRTHGGDEDHEVVLEIPDTLINGSLFFKRYPTNDAWTEVKMERRNDELVAHLPHQPAAGKLTYYIQLTSKNEVVDVSSDVPVVIRFKGSVPAYIMLPHILLMFFSMLLSNLAGLLASVKHRRHIFYGKLTLALFFVGGLILGPLVQFHAFGEAWTGIPFGWDLTDNKTLISFVFWVAAVAMNWKKDRPAYTLLAAVVLLFVYSIPHSMFGSELDYSSGEVVQGFINFIR